MGPAWRDDPLYRASQALVRWWPAEGHAFDLAGPYHFRGGYARFAEGRCGLGFSFPDGQGAVLVGGVFRRPIAIAGGSGYPWGYAFTTALVGVEMRWF